MTERPPSDTDISRLLQLAGRRPAVPEEATARVHDTVRARWQAAVRARRRRRIMALAAVAAVAALAGLLLGRRAPAPPAVPIAWATVERVTGGGRHMASAGEPALHPGALVPAGCWLGTAADGRAALRTLAGVSLRLDRDTRLRALSATSAWLERGGVYVDSGSPARSAALRIETREGKVTDVGTQFQVTVAGGGVQVSVREGRVLVFDRSGRHDADAGARLDLSGGSVQRTDVPRHGLDWAWVEQAAPEYDIEGQTLQAFLGWVSRETGLGIRFEDQSLERSARGTLLHGSSRGLTASQAIEAVLPASDLVVRQRGGTLWIARARQSFR